MRDGQLTKATHAHRAGRVQDLERILFFINLHRLDREARVGRTQ